jgi:flagellar biosynthesis component FlhA
MKKIIVAVGLLASLIITDIRQEMKINSLEEKLDELTIKASVLAQSDSILLNLQANTVQVLHDHIKNPPYPAEHSPSR